MGCQGRPVRCWRLQQIISYQYDCNLAMLKALRAKDQTADKISAGLTRSAISANWAALTHRQLPLPEIKPDVNDDAAPFASGRHGARYLSQTARTHHSEKAMIASLPDDGHAAERLTLTEVRNAHAQHSKQPSAFTIGRRKLPECGTVRDYAKASMC